MLLLSQHARGMRRSEVADALDISYTGAEKALNILVADGLAAIAERRFTLVPSPRTDATVAFALAYLPSEVALQTLARGNAAVEFAGVDDVGSVVVFRRFSESAAEHRLRQAAESMERDTLGLRVEIMRKEDVREGLLTDLSRRRRAAGMRVLVGSVDVTFPDRTKHGDDAAPPLGRLHDSIARPSATRLRTLARRYGLGRILAFGSVTRTDFRPDSDIDLLVEPLSGHHLGLDERVGLITDAEQLFGRDVDVLVGPVRRVSLARQIDRDRVVLFDAAR